MTTTMDEILADLGIETARPKLDSERATTLTVQSYGGDLTALIELADLLGDSKGWTTPQMDAYIGSFVRANLTGS